MIGLCTRPRHEAGKRFHGSIQLEHKNDPKARDEASPDCGGTLAMTSLSQGCRQSASEYGPNLIYDYAVARGDQELADFVNAWIELKQKDGMTARLYDYGFWD